MKCENLDNGKTDLFLSKYNLQNLKTSSKITKFSILLHKKHTGFFSARSLLHDVHAVLPVVRLGRLLVVLVGLAEDDLVVPQAERVAVQSHGVEVHVRVGALGLNKVSRQNVFKK